jgi:hypothetical protein
MASRARIWRALDAREEVLERSEGRVGFLRESLMRRERRGGGPEGPSGPLEAVFRALAVAREPAGRVLEGREKPFAMAEPFSNGPEPLLLARDERRGGKLGQVLADSIGLPALPGPALSLEATGAPGRSTRARSRAALLRRRQASKTCPPIALETLVLVLAVNHRSAPREAGREPRCTLISARPLPSSARATITRFFRLHAERAEGLRRSRPRIERPRRTAARKTEPICVGAVARADRSQDE